MTLQRKDESHKKTREAQMPGERKKSTRVKEFYDTSDIARSVVKSCGMIANEANLRNVRRIVELMNEATDNKRFKSKDKNIFDKVVGITKRIYNDEGNLKKLLSRERLKKNLTVEEYDILISAFVEELNNGKSIEEQNQFCDKIEILKGEKLINEATEYKKYFNTEYTNIIDMLLELYDWERRMELFNKYKCLMNILLQKFKLEVEKQKEEEDKFEKAVNRLREKEPDLFNTEEFRKGEISEEFQVKLAVEMDLEEAINDFREYIKGISHE